MAMIAAIGIGNVVDDQLNFAILLDSDFHHAGVLLIALFVFQRHAYFPGVQRGALLFGIGVNPGRKHQIPAVVVTFG
ncbi:hypothetical protein NGUA15_02777 [Salmonella enterica]|nr:hypothetical protein NGUA15_02777 [Salmonella enterica]